MGGRARFGRDILKVLQHVSDCFNVNDYFLHHIS
jgi:hypothetical protein